MQLEIASKLVEAVKDKLSSVNLKAEEIALVTITTLYTMAGFSAKNTAHNRARFLRGAGDMVESILTSD
jgi:hypothetical protein